MSISIQVSIQVKRLLLATFLGSVWVLTSAFHMPAAQKNSSDILIPINFLPNWQVEAGSGEITVQIRAHRDLGRLPFDRVNLLHFNPDDPSSCVIDATVALDALQFSDEETTETAHSADWLATEEYPFASFRALHSCEEVDYEILPPVFEEFAQQNSHIRFYQARGSLRIRGQRQAPIEMAFAIASQEAGQEVSLTTPLEAVGHIVLNRLDFGVGAESPDVVAPEISLVISFKAEPVSFPVNSEE